MRPLRVPIEEREVFIPNPVGSEHNKELSGLKRLEAWFPTWRFISKGQHVLEVRDETKPEVMLYDVASRVGLSLEGMYSRKCGERKCLEPEHIMDNGTGLFLIPARGPVAARRTRAKRERRTR
jgi:hypothetical protein